MPARHLRPADEPEDSIPKELVDPTTGAMFDLEGYVGSLKDQLAGAERDLRGWRQRFSELKRDKDAEAREDEKWPVALRVFTYWRTRCNHPRSEFTRDRFELIAGFLEHYKGGSEKLHPFQKGEELCKRAIDGAAYDPFVTKRSNGSEKRHDGIDLIFRNADKFEEFVNRAPRAAPPPPEPEPAPDPAPTLL